MAQKSLASDATVRDVCTACNSGVLSDLDMYGARCLTAAGLMSPNFGKTSLDLFYDHDKLLRWLLKVSFNAVRTTSASSVLHKEFVPFVLGKAPAPAHSRLFLLAQLVAPVGEKDRSAAYTDPASAALITRYPVFNPFLFRIGHSFVPGLPDGSCAIRALHIGALVFYLVMPALGTTSGASRALSRRICAATDGTEVSPTRKHVQLHASRASWFDQWMPQLTRELAIRSRRKHFAA